MPVLVPCNLVDMKERWREVPNAAPAYFLTAFGSFILRKPDKQAWELDWHRALYKCVCLSLVSVKAGFHSTPEKKALGVLWGWRLRIHSLYCFVSHHSHLPRVGHNSLPVSNSRTLIDWRALPANGSVTETTKRWFCMFFLHTFLSPPVRALSRNRGLGSLVRGSVSVGILRTRERSTRGCHALLFLPPVTKPDPHHLLVQL